MRTGKNNRTGRAKQYYLNYNVVEYILWKTKRTKKRSQSAFVNSAFYSLMEHDHEFKKYMEEYVPPAEDMDEQEMPEEKPH